MPRKALDELLLMADHGAKTRWHVVLNLPELNMAMFTFLLNLVWEMLQIPFFRGMTEARHWDAVLLCTQATLGDVGIALVAFWIVACLGGGRTWPLRPSAGQIAGFTALGMIATIAAAMLAVALATGFLYVRVPEPLYRRRAAVRLLCKELAAFRFALIGLTLGSLLTGIMPEFWVAWAGWAATLLASSTR
jgi:hypothetical protein